MYSGNQPCPSRLVKNPVPSSWWKPESWLQSASPVKMNATARKVSGTIEMIPRTVAKPAPTRMPRYAGMKNRTIPTTAMPSVHHAMKVLIGVNPDDVSSPNRSASYNDGRIIFRGPTGNHPSQYIHDVTPL